MKRLSIKSCDTSMGLIDHILSQDPHRPQFQRVANRLTIFLIGAPSQSLLHNAKIERTPMAYITADGRVHRGERPGNRAYKCVREAFSGLPAQWKFLVGAILALVLRHVLNPNPFANGRIPAADAQPEDHWKIIRSDESFMRRLAAHLGGNRNTKLEHDLKMRSDKIEIVMGRVDFGGPDGHLAEGGDWNDMESMRGTRCSTTRSAVTAYFCGADVAKNQDVSLRTNRKPSMFGVESFASYVACRHKQAETNGRAHRRSVYRIGVGCEDSLAGYSHAFNIVAQPDGTFLWLQSYIGQYSLQAWMDKKDTEGNPAGKLTLDQLLGRLKKLVRLMNIYGWTPQANSDYYELFGVDKEEQALKRSKPSVSRTWDPAHRLSMFVWDEACEYPLPAQPQPARTESADKTENEENQLFDLFLSAAKEGLDECSIGLAKFFFEDLGRLGV